MRVMLVSACEKRAIKKTRSILDSYALRVGECVWTTPVTEEGLSEIRSMLRRTATRQTSVACYRLLKNGESRLAWIVGSARLFGDDGTFAVNSTSRKTRIELPTWVRRAALIASTAGLTHDLGKYADFFQKKLKSSEPIKDPVRHEWISMHLLEALGNGEAWEKTWATIGGGIEGGRALAGPLRCAAHVLEYVVATHHRLPREHGVGQAAVGALNHVRDATAVIRPVAKPPQSLLQKIVALYQKIKALPSQGDHALYWRGVATLARLGLIMADHSVSSEDHSARRRGRVDAWANTVRGPGARMNQPLDWHLQAVGDRAGRIVSQLARLCLPSLSPQALQRIDAPAEGAFAWQNDVADALKREAVARCPTVVFNIASTGSGKTRMNARAVVALSDGRPVRFATALNLRTLTLQTADAYRDQIGIPDAEMACVIGDRVARAFHEHGRQSGATPATAPVEGGVDADTDGNSDEVQYNIIGESDPLPQWLQELVAGKPKMQAVIGAPALVSTIDYLVGAGDPTQRVNHYLAMIRLMTSDLIVDEIDSYEPEALIAVCRIVMLCGFWGRNVIASSATLSVNMAQAVLKAFAQGVAMRAAVHDKVIHGRYAIFDESAWLDAGETQAHEAFLSDYRRRIADISSRHRVVCRRKPSLIRIPADVQEGLADRLGCWHDAIATAALRLHENHHFVAGCKRMSFGLIRVANISGAVPLARYLAQQLPFARVCCYHSMHFAVQRYNIERNLDLLLKRKGRDPNAHILSNPGIRSAIDSHPLEWRDLPFIVVATPVEEIGRDHDFDWAIIEPSSAQSIVQTSGRVLRHREIEPASPNVGILQFNRRAIIGKHPAFSRPGYETSEHPYGTADMEELLDWRNLKNIDSGVRFGDHMLSKLDDRNIALKIDEPLILRVLKAESNLWMSEDSYLKYPLRSRQGPILEDWILDVDDEKFKRAEKVGKNEYKFIDRHNKISIVRNRAPNDWLSLSVDEMKVLAEEVGVEMKEAFTIRLPACTGSRTIIYDPSFGAYGATQ